MIQLLKKIQHDSKFVEKVIIYSVRFKMSVSLVKEKFVSK